MAIAEPWTRPAVSRRESASDSHITAPTTAKAATRPCSTRTYWIICGTGSGSLDGRDGAVGHGRRRASRGDDEVGRRVARDDVAAALDLGDLVGRQLATPAQAADQGHAGEAERDGAEAGDQHDGAAADGRHDVLLRRHGDDDRDVHRGPELDPELDPV